MGGGGEQSPPQEGGGAVGPGDILGVAKVPLRDRRLERLLVRSHWLPNGLVRLPGRLRHRHGARNP